MKVLQKSRVPSVLMNEPAIMLILGPMYLSMTCQSTQRVSPYRVRRLFAGVLALSSPNHLL